MALHEDSEPAWQTMAMACRWGIVVVCMILVPGVAFIGQGIGRWLRVQSTNRWSTRLPAEPLAAPAQKPGPAVQRMSATVAPAPVSPAESAAVYSGRKNNDPSLASPLPPARDANVVPTSFGEVANSDSRFPATSLGQDRFTELEQELQAHGAISYVLESDRRSRKAYRIECVMPGVGPGAPEQRMEAFGATALEAIQTLVQQLNFAQSKSR